jgi:5'-phosphate synthase pdxT subunit
VSKPIVGVLALQGDYEAHAKALLRAGAETLEVRRLADLEHVQALVIPGGESTVMGMLLERFGMFERLKARIDAGMPVFATCAGLILLSNHIEGSDQTRLGTLDITVRRNAYGRQIDSFHALIQTRLPGIDTIDGIFIRAPRIISMGQGVSVLATLHDEPVMVQQKAVIAATFHPELLADAPIHRWFVSSIVEQAAAVRS